MYHMDESTEEDWELEHYGLEGSHSSESDDTDSEFILYRHIHYGQSDTGIIHTNDAELVLESLPNVKSIRHFRTCKELQDENCKESKAQISSSKRKVDEGNQNGICRIFDDDSDSGTENSKYKVGSNGKQAIYSNRFGTSSSDSNIPNHCSHSCTDSDTDESDVIFVTEEENRCRKEDKEFAHNTEAPVRKHLQNVGNSKQKAHKIDRDGYKAISVVEGRHKSENPRSTGIKSVRLAEVVVDEPSDSATKGSSSIVSKQTQSSDPSQTKVAALDFFIDSKGMHLDEMRKDRDDAQLAWRKEKKKTQEMLKEASEQGFVHWSSEEEDCMMIESCSEEEGINVHIEGRGSTVQEKETKHRVKAKEKQGRYYVQSEQNYIKCHNCMEVGHVKANCPKPPYVPTCIFCGVRGHTDRECPKALCFNCTLPGHQARTCPVKRNLRYASCTRCQMSGHLRKMCPDLWRQYHLTTEHGPLVTATRSEKKTKKDVYCSNCSEKGHKYYDCHSERMDDFVMFTYDEICQYDTKFVRKQTVERNYPYYNHQGDWRDIILRDRQALLNQGQKRKLPALEVDGVNGVETNSREEGPSKKCQRVTGPSVQAGSEHHKTQDKVIEAGVNKISDDENVKGIGDRGSSDDDSNPAGLCLPFRGKTLKKKSRKSHPSVLLNKIQKSSKTKGGDLLRREVTEAFSHPAASNQVKEQVTKKERQKLRREKWLAKRQQQPLTKRYNDDSTKHNVGNPASHTSTRGFILNRDLLQDGSHSTRIRVSNSEFINEDFPRSTPRCNGMLLSERGQTVEGGQKGHQKNKLGQKIKSHLLHLQERLGMGGVEAEGRVKRNKKRPRRRKSRTKGERGFGDISISGLLVVPRSSTPPVRNCDKQLQNGKKRRRKRRGR